MKAVQVKSYGGVEVLEVNANVPEPILKENQVLVKVIASSINPFDVKIRSGVYKDSMPMNFPFIPGGDFAGVVKEIGNGVSEYQIGDEIFGSALINNGGSGAMAEEAVANVKNSANKPQKIDFSQAASLPLVGSSAIQALEEHIQLKPNQKILIQGGAGGIGSIAIQLAKHLGAHVAATVSTDDVQFAKDLGADEVIDYRSQRFEEILKDFDAVFDTVGSETTNRSFKVLKSGGVIVSMVGAPSEELAKQYGVTAIGQGTHTNREHLTRLAQLVDQGTIKPQVDKEFSLDQIQEAFKYQEEIHPKGKVVIKIR